MYKQFNNSTFQQLNNLTHPRINKYTLIKIPISQSEANASSILPEKPY